MADSASFEFMKEWALRYVRHRDIAARKISGLKDTGYGFVIVNNDGSSTGCFVQPSLQGVKPALFATAAVADKESKESMRNILIVTLSNSENIQAVYRMWDVLAANSGMLVVFANPFSALEDKWVLKPHLHNRVCDRGSLLQGLRAMSGLVEPIDEETLALKLRPVGKAETDARAVHRQAQ
ncbi:hypothetical protein HYV85_06365 [Candidatus Woesearchaeota archaeon]|nr:hypothetical protein [Candidatus Woesearchaeota archaeon]